MIKTFYGQSWMLGAGMTIPLPFVTIVLYKYKGNEVSEGIKRHEMWHVEQARRLGLANYWATHIYWRIRRLNLFVGCTPAEWGAYKAQYDYMSDDELRKFLADRGWC